MPIGYFHWSNVLCQTETNCITSCTACSLLLVLGMVDLLLSIIVIFLPILFLTKMYSSTLVKF